MRIRVRGLQISHAGFPQFLELWDWGRSLAANVPGQSGQPASPRYAGLVPLWAEGRYFPLLYSREAIEKQSVEKLELIPR